MLQCLNKQTITKRFFKNFYTSVIPKVGLDIQEKLIFEQGNENSVGIDFEQPDISIKSRLGHLKRNSKIGLPNLNEVQVIRHYSRLARFNYGVDTGLYPLGSCTMKYNPRINEKVARIPNLAFSHPFLPTEAIQGSLGLIDRLAEDLLKITGMNSICMSPAAGAHGELCAMQTIAQAHKKQGNTHKKYILIPDAAHGTNPATSAMAGFKVRVVKSTKNGKIDLEDFKKKCKDDVAGAMITNPNTCGLFENDICKIAEMLHEKGAYLFMDGANMNALMGRVFVSDLGVDAMHMNLHKTFSTPHGSSGPGSGPVVFSEKLTKYAPIPYIVNDEGEFKVIEKDRTGNSFGRMKAYFGQVGIHARALAYISAYGNGLASVSGDSVLNANYVKFKLEKEMSLGYPKNKYCMHEVLFSDNFLKGTTLTTLDFAKAMIDAGYHPPTIYFPLVVHGAMLIEPTESESKETLDDYCKIIIDLAINAKTGKYDEDFHEAPTTTIIRRADETRAAKFPILTYQEK
ncbi:glycine dehydrogenase (decarboxylating) [Anaeramoeba flamelloides]|uniref:glycine dehydrogenase (aminomethyl-transferring) n=1 Tax=Anaeramoeba flamelloides TaxID=1746091 RepID=A0AAV7YTI0_9EUKA|nr:glycine dehydrogenase (decarboxylating) [Anaeramoeba flamelloides]|eukprot:Anaeramoba_flamelloidesa567057_888.p1 GENE.a567057_888~~a567057_888.p1  ORF type:complete len:514 (-),score=95.54 a567057_888:548-2089(-)